MVTRISIQKVAVFFIILLVIFPFADICAQSYRGSAEWINAIRSARERRARSIRNQQLFDELWKSNKERKKKNKKEKTNTDKKAQLVSGDVQLTVFADGKNKDEAIQTALRSAIEQAFGVFVSSHTEILNDSLVKDEIATVASGNIKEFKCLSENYVEGKCFVTVQAVVSTNNLISYTKSKGASAELAGATFAMNLRMLELNKRNEALAMQHLVRQLAEIAPIMFDYEIKIGEFNAGLGCPLEICINVNKNAKIAYKMLTETLEALSLKDVEVSDLKKIGITTHKMSFSTYFDDKWIANTARPPHEIIYHFRHPYHKLFHELCEWFVACSMNFKLIDDFGSYSVKYTTDRKNTDFRFSIPTGIMRFKFDCNHISINGPLKLERYGHHGHTFFKNSVFLYFAHDGYFQDEVALPFHYYKNGSSNNSGCRLEASIRMRNIEELSTLTKIQIERGQEILKVSDFIKFQ